MCPNLCIDSNQIYAVCTVCVESATNHISGNYFYCNASQFSSRNPRKSYRTYWGIPVSTASKIKLYTSICLFLCTLGVRNQQVTSNCSITWSSHVTHRPVCGELCWLDYRIGKLLYWNSDCLHTVSDWMISSNIATWILIRTYILRTTNKTLPPFRIFVLRNPWHPFAEPSLRNAAPVEGKIQPRRYFVLQVTCP